MKSILATEFAYPLTQPKGSLSAKEIPEKIKRFDIANVLEDSIVIQNFRETYIHAIVKHSR